MRKKRIAVAPIASSQPPSHTTLSTAAPGAFAIPARWDRSKSIGASPADNNTVKDGVAEDGAAGERRYRKKPRQDLADDDDRPNAFCDPVARSARPSLHSFADSTATITAYTGKGTSFPEPSRVIQPCSNVEELYEKLNRIEEGAYGVVYRARSIPTNRIVALKRLKVSRDVTGGALGFPLTSLREIRALLASRRHENIVNVEEIVVGGTPISVYIVMEFVEHDLRTLLEHHFPHSPLMVSELKTMMLQLLRAMGHLHRHHLIHRDIKTSNLLLDNRGHLKVADFGLARTWASDDLTEKMTTPVVTLYYRAPELLLGSQEYGTPVDMWSVGCVMAELLCGEVVAQGRGEIDQIGKMFRLLGIPTEAIWPGFSQLPVVRSCQLSGSVHGDLAERVRGKTTHLGLDLLRRLLTYDPLRRITAAEALEHPYFLEQPLPKHPDQFPSWPSRAALQARAKVVHEVDYP